MKMKMKGLKKMFKTTKGADSLLMIAIGIVFTWLIAWLLAMVLETIVPALTTVAFENALGMDKLDVSMSSVASFLILMPIPMYLGWKKVE